MSSKIIKIFGLSLWLLWMLVSCSSHKEIPEETLEQILVESALINSTTTYSPKVRAMADTLDLYSAVLDKYGYDIEDMEYTLRSLISRKSTAMEAVLESAKSSITSKREFLDYMYDMITESKLVVDKSIIDTLYSVDTTIHIKSTKLIDSIRLQLPLEGAGKYTLSIDYISYTKKPVRTIYSTIEMGDSLFNDFRAKETQSRIFRLPVRTGVDTTINRNNIVFNLDGEDGGNTLLINLITHNPNARTKREPTLQERSLSKELDLIIKKIQLTRKPDYLDGNKEYLKDVHNISAFDVVSLRLPYSHSPLRPEPLESWGSSLERYNQTPRKIEQESFVLKIGNRFEPITSEDLEQMDMAAPDA